MNRPLESGVGGLRKKAEDSGGASAFSLKGTLAFPSPDPWYNILMEVDAVRVTCPACGSRLTVMPRVQYLACTHCGSEYLVQRRGSAVGLETFAADQYEISRQI